jgi:polyribonucleotide 5'-hydroxyl-kinase
MQNCLLAILFADINDSQQNLRDAPVMGFVNVVDVDMKKKWMRVVSPVSGRLPDRPLIWGSWPEAVGNLIG